MIILKWIMSIDWYSDVKEAYDITNKKNFILLDSIKLSNS